VLAPRAVCDSLIIEARKTQWPKRPAHCPCDRGARGIGIEIVRLFLADGNRVAFVATKTEYVERALDLLGYPEDRLYDERIDVTLHNDV